MIFDCTLAAAHARMLYIQQTRQCLEAEHSARRHHGKEVGTIRYDTRCYFNVRSKADISQLNLPHGTDN